MRFVPDTSVALAWCFEDEASEDAEQLLPLLKSGSAVVPSHWPVEVVSGLMAGERRKRISADGVAQSLRLLSQLSVTVDEAPSLASMSKLADVARVRRVSPYDAAFLTLALRLKLPLATVDRRLAEAARPAKVEVLGRLAIREKV